LKKKIEQKISDQPVCRRLMAVVSGQLEDLGKYFAPLRLCEQQKLIFSQSR